MTDPDPTSPIRQPKVRRFETDPPDRQRLFERAVEGLTENTQVLPDGDGPVLIEGGPYHGVWLESGPIDARAAAVLNPEPYRAAHELFFSRQRDNGQLPCFVRQAGAGWSQVQTVTSIATSALHCATHYADDAFLSSAYTCCARWDHWLVQHRDHQHLGLCEAFSEYDTGHDKSPRWRGLPKICHEGDAGRCPPDPVLPYLAPDLSASLYGGRLALATMAQRLGRPDEAEQWRQRAERTRRAILEHCFDETDLCFYDRDATGQFVRIVGDVLMRVLAEPVVDQALFERIFQRWVMNPEAFWPTLPLPSVALCDEAFDWSQPVNSWGGPAQPLTALRAPAWFERHGKFAELDSLMQRWIEALLAAPGFLHQGDPCTGRMDGPDGYTPAMCVAVDFLLRSRGVSLFGDDRLSWGCGAGQPGERTTCVLACDQGVAELHTKGNCSTLTWDGQRIAHVRGRARIMTDAVGRVRQVIGTHDTPEHVELTLMTSEPDPITLTLAPNAVVELDHTIHNALKLQVTP